MIRASCLALLVAAASSAAVASERAVVVLDASGATARPGAGGVPLIASAREALAAVAAETSGRGVEHLVGLRLAGGDPRVGGIDGCAATRSLLAADEVEPAAWFDALDGVEPYGPRPLVAAVLAALADLEPATGTRRVVVVTAGDDQCGRSPAEVAAALADLDPTPELRLVGLGLEPAVVDRYGAVPTRNAASAEELLAALRWAVLDRDSEERPVGALRLRLTGDDVPTAETELELSDLAAAATETAVVGDLDRLELPCGRYRLTFVAGHDPARELRGVAVVPGAETEVEIDLRPPPESWLDVVPEAPTAGNWLRVDVVGGAVTGAAVLVVGSSGDASSPLSSLEGGGAWMTAPHVAGDFELLLVGPHRAGGRRVLARHPLPVGPMTATLEAPAEAPAEGRLAVSWTGPGAAGDAVALVPRGGAASAAVACAEAGPGNELELATPAAEGELDLVFIAGATAEVAARNPVRITGPAAVVAPPPAVTAGDVFEVAWEGPEKAEDFISVAPVGAADDAYLDWARVDEGNPVSLRAPAAPGAYEVRYVDGTNGEVRTRVPVEVAAVPATVRGPETATAGLRFEVHWTGPAADGDFLTVSEPAEAPDRYHDWASTAGGSPTTLAAPDRPGSYEIRYVAGAGREVLARSPIEVLP